jgi:hypothetical protein
MSNGFKLWPATIAGEKLKVIILDDATDPTKGVQNARRFVTEDKVDLIIGSGVTPVAIPMPMWPPKQDGAAGLASPSACRLARTPGPSACRRAMT